MGYGSTNGGMTWYPNKVDADGHLQVDVLSGGGGDPWKTLADDGTLRAAENSAVNTTSTIYTVPANKVFYLTSAMLMYMNNGVSSSADAILKVNGMDLLLMRTPDEANAHDVVSINPTIPLKLIATQIITIHSDDAQTRAVGTISGYEIAA